MMAVYIQSQCVQYMVYDGSIIYSHSVYSIWCMMAVYIQSQCVQYMVYDGGIYTVTVCTVYGV